METGKADKKYLQPMYDKLNTAIRAIDEEHLIFYEPTLSDYIHIDAGFEHGELVVIINQFDASSWGRAFQ